MQARGPAPHGSVNHSFIAESVLCALQVCMESLLQATVFMIDGKNMMVWGHGHLGESCAHAGKIIGLTAPRLWKRSLLEADRCTIVWYASNFPRRCFVLSISYTTGSGPVRVLPAWCSQFARAAPIPLSVYVDEGQFARCPPEQTQCSAALRGCPRRSRR